LTGKDNASKKLNRPPEQWEGIWAQKFKGRRILATHWINYGRYVLVGYPSSDLAASARP
jgi:hypothetical protein